MPDIMPDSQPAMAGLVLTQDAVSVSLEPPDTLILAAHTTLNRVMRLEAEVVLSVAEATSRLLRGETWRQDAPSEPVEIPKEAVRETLRQRLQELNPRSVHEKVAACQIILAEYQALYLTCRGVTSPECGSWWENNARVQTQLQKWFRLSLQPNEVKKEVNVTYTHITGENAARAASLSQMGQGLNNLRSGVTAPALRSLMVREVMEAGTDATEDHE
jgi:hypothetical protein